MSPYKFNSQLAQGHRGECELDRYFADRFQVFHASPADQRRGIDREWRCVESGRSYWVEYKTDKTAISTGNCFIETISVANPATNDFKLGWAYTSASDLLVYYLPQTRIYVVTFERLRERLSDWEDTYPQRRIPNQNYCTHGLLVPLAELASISEEVLTYRTP